MASEGPLNGINESKQYGQPKMHMQMNHMENDKDQALGREIPRGTS
jgi:hypothetical protein